MQRNQTRHLVKRVGNWIDLKVPGIRFRKIRAHTKKLAEKHTKQFGAFHLQGINPNYVRAWVENFTDNPVLWKKRNKLFKRFERLYGVKLNQKHRNELEHEMFARYLLKMRKQKLTA